MRRRLLTIFAAVLLPLWATAQPYCSVKTFNLRDGLASNVITSLQQTPDQLLWFSTWNGLTCYDGYRFTTFRDTPLGGHQRVLTTNRLLNSEANSTGNIWCITYDQNAFLFDRRSGQYVDITSRINRKFNIEFHTNRAITTAGGHTWLLNTEVGGPAVRIDDRNFQSDDAIELIRPDDEPLSASEIFWVYENSQGQEFLFTDRGLVSIDGTYRSDRPFRFVQEVGQYVFLGTIDGKICLLDNQSQQQMDLSLPPEVNALGALMSSCNDQMVAATNAGFFVYDTRQHRGRLIHVPVQANEQSITHALYIDRQCRMWMGTENGDVLRVDLSDDSVELLQMAAQTPRLKQSSHTFFHEDRYHTLWAATSHGFFGYYDEQRHQFVGCQLRTSATQPVIERWFFDAQDNLWYSGDHDLAMVRFSRRNITHVDNMQEVRSIMFDRHNRVWAGTLAGDIAIFTPDGQLQGYLAPDGHVSTQSVRFSTHIYCLFQDRQQRIWIGTKGDGLYCLAPDGRLSHYTLGQLPSNQVYDVHQDHQGRIWVGTFEKGICLLQDDGRGGVTFSNAPEQLKGYPISDFHKVRRITETHDGTIIVSASNGLVTFSEQFSNPADIRFYAHKHVRGDSTSLMTSDVMQALVTDNDSVFIATVGGGVQMVRADELLSDKLTLHSVNRVLIDQGTVMTLLQDKQGNLWTGRENSINMFDHTTHQLWRFGPSHLGEQTEFTEAEPAFNPLTGQVALATTDGFICFQPEQLKEDQFVPPLVFTGVQLHGEQGLRHTLQGDSLELNADQRNLTIYFAALDYQDNYMISYAYMLEGVDHDWNELGSEHSITFNNLPPGRHRLLVRSTNNYGTWVDNVRILYIYAHPTFWESWWAKLLYAMLILLVVGVAIWIYRLYTRNSMERKLNDMKTQFFTDVSHKLRTPLTLIGGPVTEVLRVGGLTDMARKHLEMVERNAHRMLELVNKMLTYSKEHHTYISDVSPTPDPSRGGEGSKYLPGSPSTADVITPLPPAGGAGGEAVRLLIVEDNDDLRQFLVSILQSDYEVLEASNGLEGLQKAESEQPDFILTDVMMPQMDGLEMVHRIKANQDISHIPIVILSAKASMDDRLEGLKAGVNDYITKPFSATYLKQRMQNIIQNQRLLQQSVLASIKPSAETEPAEVVVNTTPDVPPTNYIPQGPTLQLAATNLVDTDKQFMEQLLDYIEKNLSNPDLVIDDLASALCVGRTVFYSKVKTLVGMSPVELLRHIRLQHAEDMVARSKEPFSQIAYAVGFSDPRYFGKCFKKETGLTPSEYREKAGKV
ncbi:MAG: response regulator [Prevotella sp.]|nr:response regulator [Prevotella sp.]